MNSRWNGIQTRIFHFHPHITSTDDQEVCVFITQKETDFLERLYAEVDSIVSRNDVGAE